LAIAPWPARLGHGCDCTMGTLHLGSTQDNADGRLPWVHTRVCDCLQMGMRLGGAKWLVRTAAMCSLGVMEGHKPVHSGLGLQLVAAIVAGWVGEYAAAAAVAAAWTGVWQCYLGTVVLAACPLAVHALAYMLRLPPAPSGCLMSDWVSSQGRALSSLVQWLMLAVQPRPPPETVRRAFPSLI
jgi:hypothetical protein